MPGTLKKNAKCPNCRTPLEAIARTYHSNGGTTAEYFHQKGYHGNTRISPKARRKIRCRVFYPAGSALPNLDR